MRISLGSGATLATQVVDGAHMQIISGPTLAPSPNYIGLASVNVGGTLPALSSGTNFIGLATIVAGAAVPVTDNSLSLTVDWLSGATVAISNLPSVTVGAALPAGANYIGLVSVSGSLAISSGATVNVMNFPTTQPVSVTGLVSLPSGTEVKSLATILNWPATQAVTQSGTWNVGLTALTSLASGTEIRSLATILNFPAAQGVTGLISLASGTEVRSLATILNFPATQAATQSGTWNVGVTGLTSLASGTEVRSLATILNFPTTQAVTQSGTWNVGLSTGANYIGLATVVQGNQPALVASSAYIGLASVNIGGTLPALTAGSAFIGLATIIPTFYSLYTSLATVISAAGAATLVVPPSGKTVVIKDLFISSLGRGEINVCGANGSATTVRIPYTALATTGGYISNFGDGGLRVGKPDDSLTFTLNSAATVSVMANVRFE